MVLSVRWVQYLVPVFFILLYHLLHVMVSSNNLGKKKMNTGNNWHHKTWVSFELNRTGLPMQSNWDTPRDLSKLLSVGNVAFPEKLHGWSRKQSQWTAPQIPLERWQTPLLCYTPTPITFFRGCPSPKVIRKADLFTFTTKQCSYYLESTISHMPNWL